MRQYISCRVNFKKPYASVSRRVLYNTYSQRAGAPVKLVRLIKMCLNKSYITVHIGERMSDQFPLKSSVKEGDALLLLLVT
jgi:hypothetical protein